MNIHTQLQDFDESFVEQLQQAARTAPKLPIAYVAGERIYPGAVLRAMNEGEPLDSRVMDIIRSTYDSSYAVAA